MNRKLAMLALGASFLFASASFAVDGVKLIGQPRPTAFPFTISSPGSYRLKSNITVPDENTTAIVVAADDVTIDLNGYSIRGGTVCTGVPVTSCTPTGSGKGIDASTHSNVTVMNGTIRGVGNVGILLLQGSIENVKLLSNGSHGIEDADIFLNNSPVMVTNCAANSNGGFGIRSCWSAIGTTTSFNQADGMFAGGTVSNCSAEQNGGNGIAGYGNVTTILNSTAGSNGGWGLAGYVVTNSAATGNASGIQGSAVSGCAASGNTTLQISAVGLLGQNLCGGTPCP